MASAGEEKWQSYSFRNWSRSGWYLTQRWVHGGKLMKLVLGAIVVYPCFPQAVSFEDRTWGTWQLLLHGMRHFAKLRVSETILCYERAFNFAHFVLRVLLCWWTLQKTIIDLIVLIHSTYIGLTDSPAYHFHSSRLLSIYFIVYRDSLFWSWGSGIYDASNSTRHRNDSEWRLAPEKAKQCASHLSKGSLRKSPEITENSPVWIRAMSFSEGLHLTYTSQGNVAGSPDYGIVPSGLLAMASWYREVLVCLCAYYCACLTVLWPFWPILTMSHQGIRNNRS